MKRLAALLLLLLAPAAARAQVFEYYHLDGIGSVRAVTDGNGALIERHDYLPFGEELNAAPAPQPRRFTGKERDAETGLDYFGARYLSAKLGRFTSVDPLQTMGENLADPQRWNRYVYARNNPLRVLDPDGRDWFWCDGHAPIWVQPNSKGPLPAGWQTFAPRDASHTLRVDYMDGNYTIGVNGDGSPRISYREQGLIDATDEMTYVTGAFVGPLTSGGSQAAAAVRPILLGDNFKERVAPTAARLGADTFDKSWTFFQDVMGSNVRWLYTKARSGTPIFDIGLDIGEQRLGAFYKVEVSLLREMGFTRRAVGTIDVNGELRTLYRWFSPD